MKEANCYWKPSICQHSARHFRYKISHNKFVHEYIKWYLPSHSELMRTKIGHTDEDFLYSYIIALFRDMAEK